MPSNLPCGAQYVKYIIAPARKEQTMYIKIDRALWETYNRTKISRR
jgi:hypothetical protein